MKKMNKQAGFTLIELIIVIVILGVLSAFALPRFADLGSEARTASLQGVAGSLKAASAIAHSKWIVDDVDGMQTSVELEGASVDMVGSYPEASATGITEAAQIDDSATGDYPATYTAGTAAAAGAVSSAGTVVYELRDLCKVTYTEATYTGADAAAVPPTADVLETTPTVVIVDSGC